MKRTYRNLLGLGVFITSLALLTGCSDNANKEVATDPGAMTGTDSRIEVLTGTKFTLTATESHLMINETNMRTAWTFNGTVPGPQIRAKLGDMSRPIENSSK